MNIKLHLGEVVPLLDKHISEKQVHQLLNPLAMQANLLFPEVKSGSGYLQWDLPGKNWISFSDGSDNQKFLVAQEYQKRKSILCSALKGSPFETAIFTIPAEKFIYFRPQGDSWEIAVTAWGYKYPNQSGSGELDIYITKTVLQDVMVGFQWADKLLPNLTFRLNGLPRTSEEDGWFKMDGQLPIDSHFVLELHSGERFSLTVEKGKSEYIYDLTQYFQVEIAVKQDERPLENCTCEINFNGIHNVATDFQGHASLRLPMKCDSEGVLLDSQPDCIVTCMEEIQKACPAASNDVLNFVFSFKTKQEELIVPEPPIIPSKPIDDIVDPPKEEKIVHIRLQDYGGFPLPDLDFVLTTKKKGKVSLKTDSEGICIVPKEWFTPKEKMKVNFVISPEYQEKHDLHDKKSKKK